jgi:hypothetical protein
MTLVAHIAGVPVEELLPMVYAAVGALGLTLRMRRIR